MKILVIILAIAIVSCNLEENSKPKQKIECPLEDKSEDAFSALTSFYDFTIRNVSKTTYDKEGTPWHNETSDQFRFVFKSKNGYQRSRKGDLLVYKNNSLFKKYLDVLFDGVITKRVDKLNCVFNQYSEVEMSFNQGNDNIIHIFGSTNNYIVDYYSLGSTKYQGQFSQFNYSN